MEGEIQVIVIFGGAFNPPTVAHKEIYYLIEKVVDFKEFIYLPVSNLYTKRSLVSNFHRAEMIHLMIDSLPKATLSNLEFDDSDYLGTYQSLIRFQEKYPDDEISFVIGADNLKKLHKWINAKALLSEFRFIVINRHGTDLQKYIEEDDFLKDYINRFIVLAEFDSSISSTAFRETFDPSYVTEEVYDYIMKNNLYRG